MRTIAIAVALLLVGTPAKSEVSSGNYFVQACKTEDVAGAYCAGVLAGLVGQTNLLKSKAFCVPDEASNKQLIRVAMRYLEAHPERLHLDFLLLANAAFSEAFPCK